MTKFVRLSVNLMGLAFMYVCNGTFILNFWSSAKFLIEQGENGITNNLCENCREHCELIVQQKLYIFATLFNINLGW